ncbi:MAG: prepilin peptidase [Patescibacteria group bacterium]
MQLISSISIFIFGLIIGSFLNAVIYRLKFGGSIIFGRSKCPYCKKTLGFWDLIPVLSFLFLRGRCRYCHKKISWQYPIVEIITALLFLSVFNFQFSIFNFQSIFNDKIFNFQNLLSNIYYLVSFFYFLFVICCLIVIFVYDLKYSLILDKILLFVGVISIIFYAALVFLDRTFFNVSTSLDINFDHYREVNFWNLLWGMLIGGGFFLILYLLSGGRWIGAGDAKFGFLMGLWLLFPKILVALFFAFVLGGIVALILLFAGKKKMRSQISFGPFLALGTLFALLFGQQVLDWYLKWLGI